MNICVFAGSSCGKRGSYQQTAEQLGERLARRAIGLVYGGGSVGLMADLSDAFVVLPGGIGTLDEAFEMPSVESGSSLPDDWRSPRAKCRGARFSRK